MNDTDINNSEIEYKSDMAIVVVSYDGYSDLWQDYFDLLNKYWEDRKYPVYLANNTKKPNFKNVIVINGGENSQWSTRTRIAVENIKEPYICLLLEDFFTSSKIDSSVIENIMTFIKENNIKYYKLNSFSKIKGKKFKNSDYLFRIPQNLDYGISLQPAIWERNFLLELLGTEDYNAWKFEADRVKESSGSPKAPLEGCLYDNRNVLKICHGVVQGKFLPPAVKCFKKQNYFLNVENRGVMTKKEYAFYKFKLIAKNYFPRTLKKQIKRFLSKLGIKFIVNS